MGKICGEDDLEQEWLRLIREQEYQLSGSWKTHHLVPLSDSLYDFEVRYYEARKRALTLMVDAPPSITTSDPTNFQDFPSQTPTPQSNRTDDLRALGPEIRVRSATGMTRGRVDRVLVDDRGLVLQDYKSGHILEQDEESGSIVRRDYRLQLQLYAALYYDTFGRWPDVLEVLGVSGGCWQVQSSPSSCEETLQEAEDLLRRVQDITQDVLSNKRKVEDLARPSKEACRFCSYRPACSAYHQSRKREPDAGWPQDLLGTVEAIRTLGNNRLSIFLNTPEGQALWRGASRDYRRHPALRGLRPGLELHVFNVVQTSEPYTYGEGNLTTAYRTGH